MSTGGISGDFDQYRGVNIAVVGVHSSFSSILGCLIWMQSKLETYICMSMTMSETPAMIISITVSRVQILVPLFHDAHPELIG